MPAANLLFMLLIFLFTAKPNGMKDYCLLLMTFSKLSLKLLNAIISNRQHQNLTLLGFSLGGRIAFSLYQAQPETIEKIILLAPDGLKVNFWYWLSTQTLIGNNLFAFTMKYPGWFLGFLKMANKLKLVNASIFKFVNYYIGNKEVRCNCTNAGRAYGN